MTRESHRAGADGPPALPSIEQARATVLAGILPLESQSVDVAEARNRVLAADVLAAADVPAFANSAMDGFAVRAGSTGVLAIEGESRAGRPADRPLAVGTAMRISTGAALPEGADAVIPVERTREARGRVEPEGTVAAGDHVRNAGEDMRAGQVVLAKGTRLGPAELGVAVAAGAARLFCARRPAVAIVATGDELVDPGEPLGPGQIHNSNRVTLSALATRCGGLVLPPEHVPDRPDATHEALESALAHGDVTVISGGVSVGAHDHVKRALAELGVEERFWRVALRPGKPTWFGTRGRTLVFGLPGNPVSAMVTFLLFVRPALAALEGAPPTAGRRRALLAEAVPRRRERDEAVRVRLEQDGALWRARPTGPQGSHQLTSMLGADGLALIPAGPGELAAGTAVEVELIGSGDR